MSPLKQHQLARMIVIVLNAVTTLVFFTACGKPVEATAAQSSPQPIQENCPTPTPAPIVASEWCNEIIMTVSNHAYKVDLQGQNTPLADGIYSTPVVCNQYGCQPPCSFKIQNGFPGSLNSGGW